MEWTEEEEPTRRLKRKRRSRTQSRKSQEAREFKTSIFHPEVKTRSNRRVNISYIVRYTGYKASIDHPRMAMLNERIVKAALGIEESSIARAEELKLDHKYKTTSFFL